MGSNKFTLKIKFSSGVFPAKSVPSSFGLTPLCCSGAAKNCKSSFLFHGIFVIVVFRLWEGVHGKKMVSAIAGDDVPWPCVHPSVWCSCCCLACPVFGCSPPWPLPRVAWQSCSAVLALSLPFCSSCLEPGQAVVFLSKNIFYLWAVLWAVPWSCWPVRPAHLSVLCKPDQAVPENFVFFLCSLPQKWSILLHSPTTQLPGFCPLAGSLLVLYLFRKLMGCLISKPVSLSLGLVFSIAPTSFTFSVVQSSPWFFLPEAGSGPLLLFSLEASASVPLFCVCFVYWGQKWGSFAEVGGFFFGIRWLFWPSKILASPTIHLNRWW